jgi:hypothetical protein
MKTEPLVFASVCDWAGIVRGKAFPEADLDAQFEDGTAERFYLGDIVNTPEYGRRKWRPSDDLARDSTTRWASN